SKAAGARDVSGTGTTFGAAPPTARDAGGGGNAERDVWRVRGAHRSRQQGAYRGASAIRADHGLAQLRPLDAAPAGATAVCAERPRRKWVAQDAIDGP